MILINKDDTMANSKPLDNGDLMSALYDFIDGDYDAFMVSEEGKAFLALLVESFPIPADRDAAEVIHEFASFCNIGVNPKDLAEFVEDTRDLTAPHLDTWAVQSLPWKYINGAFRNKMNTWTVDECKDPDANLRISMAVLYTHFNRLETYKIVSAALALLGTLGTYRNRAIVCQVSTYVDAGDGRTIEIVPHIESMSATVTITQVSTICGMADINSVMIMLALEST